MNSGKADRELVGSMAALDLPGNPVDEVIAALGAEGIEVSAVALEYANLAIQVAELTGRRLAAESRVDKTNAFQRGVLRVAIISGMSCQHTQ